MAFLQQQMCQAACYPSSTLAPFAMFALSRHPTSAYFQTLIHKTGCMLIHIQVATYEANLLHSHCCGASRVLLHQRSPQDFKTCMLGMQAFSCHQISAMQNKSQPCSTMQHQSRQISAWMLCVNQPLQPQMCLLWAC